MMRSRKVTEELILREKEMTAILTLIRAIWKIRRSLRSIKSSLISRAEPVKIWTSQMKSILP
jgi:hypothetical protein